MEEFLLIKFQVPERLDDTLFPINFDLCGFIYSREMKNMKIALLSSFLFVR